MRRETDGAAPTPRPPPPRSEGVGGGVGAAPTGPASPPNDASGPADFRRFVLRVAVAALFWFAVWHAVALRSGPWIVASVALWVVWFIVRRAHAKARGKSP